MIPENTTSTALEHYLACPSKWSSVGNYKGPLVLRRRVEPARVDSWFIPGTPDPWIVLMTGGKRTVEVRDGKRWRKAISGPGQVGVTSPSTTTEIRWRSESSAPVETIHLHIDSVFFRRVTAECGRGDPNAIEITNALSESDPLIERLLSTLVPQLRGPDPSGHMFADAAAEMIAIHLLQRYSTRSVIVRNAETISRKKLRQVEDFVDANLGENVTLDEMARVACMSVFHFARSFKQSTGETPHAFVRLRKLEHAKRMLAETDWDVRRVARAVGYTNASHFAAVFREKSGVTPAAYRQSIR
ncbi:putative Transcriptional regulator, AraC family [Mesorhizobium delmotii]|uniref:Putative Transcriptional regulator, AraC family n=2 Tax=Mesorhizobium delmotii TaxID=1631247 RepID=A0A2P9AEZ0_9HYPH|nr:putative Transcriptional regulator, AraC family [Mesorhizobium delmotii]